MFAPLRAQVPTVISLSARARRVDGKTTGPFVYPKRVADDLSCLESSLLSVRREMFDTSYPLVATRARALDNRPSTYIVLRATIPFSEQERRTALARIRMITGETLSSSPPNDRRSVIGLSIDVS